MDALLPGTVVRDGDEYTIHFEREYRGSTDEVWSAITTPERAVRWLGELRGTLAVGERVVLQMGEAEDERADLDILACQRPDRIELGWLFPGEPYTRVVVELRPVAADRTLVVLDHLGFPKEHIPGYGCGWHHYVDRLAAYLAGEELPAFEDYYPVRLDEWRERVAAA
jgi:uncharacterized protein YndB with AHSA1/START domain